MEKVEKTEAEWKQKLTPEQYHVPREKGTERAFTGQDWDSKETASTGALAAARAVRVRHKFESGTGWPSFFDPMDHKTVEKEPTTASS